MRGSTEIYGFMDFLAEDYTLRNSSQLTVMNSHASNVTDVVPSPISASWDFAISTRVLAAGWTMSRSWRIVAPSFEM